MVRKRELHKHRVVKKRTNQLLKNIMAKLPRDVVLYIYNEFIKPKPSKWNSVLPYYMYPNMRDDIRFTLNPAKTIWDLKY